MIHIDYTKNHRIRIDIANTIRLLNEIRMERDPYIEEFGWYDRNMLNEVTDSEILETLDKIPTTELTKHLAYDVIDKIKEKTDWYRYKNEDGLFDKGEKHDRKI